MARSDIFDKKMVWVWALVWGVSKSIDNFEKANLK